MIMEDFKPEGSAEIGIAQQRLFDFVSPTPEMKKSLRAGIAEGRMAIDTRRAAAHSSADFFGSHLHTDALTSNAIQGDREMCPAVGMGDCKPIRIAEWGASLSCSMICKLGQREVTP